jgi:tRNA pseudouridine13 synthase
LGAGDVANLDGTGSIFDVESPDEVLADRVARLDVHPTGPLWGRGELRTRGEVRAFEAEVAARRAAWCTGLESADLNQERRALRLAVQNLRATPIDGGVKLEFHLQRGAFATTVLSEIVDAVDSWVEGDE